MSSSIELSEADVQDFSMFTSVFDDDFFRFLNNLRGKANAEAHSLEIFTNQKKIDLWKAKINEYSRLISTVAQKVKDTPL